MSLFRWRRNISGFMASVWRADSGNNSCICGSLADFCGNSIENETKAVGHELVSMWEKGKVDENQVDWKAAMLVLLGNSLGRGESMSADRIIKHNDSELEFHFHEIWNSKENSFGILLVLFPNFLQNGWINYFELYSVHAPGGSLFLEFLQRTASIIHYEVLLFISLIRTCELVE